MKKTHLALNGALMLLLGAAAIAPAQAGPQVWHALTQPGGAPGNPALWDQEAGYRVFGQSGGNVISVNPSFVTATTYDNSSHPTTVGPTTVEGSQTNVETNAQLGAGSTLTTATNSTDGN